MTRSLPPLGRKQQLVLDLLEGLGSCSSMAIGPALHGRRWVDHCGKDSFGCGNPAHHPETELCSYCELEAVEVLLALHRRGLVQILSVKARRREDEPEELN